MIPWSPGRKLTWDDFRGQPKPKADEVANTNTGLGVDFHLKKDRLSFEVRCEFNADKSWVSNPSDWVLRHEQGHFDISEIFARILYKRLSEYVFDDKTFKVDLDDIYQQVVREKTSLQQQYDRETDHSRNKEKQEEWLKKIDIMLESLESWKNYGGA